MENGKLGNAILNFPFSILNFRGHAECAHRDTGGALAGEDAVADQPRIAKASMRAAGVENAGKGKPTNPATMTASVKLESDRRAG